MTQLKLLGSGAISNDGEAFALEIPASEEHGMLATRVTVQPEGAAVRWSIDGDPAKGVRLANGASRIFDGAEILEALEFAFEGDDPSATLHVVFESDGSPDLSFLLERRPPGMTADQAAAFVRDVKAVPRCGMMNEGPAHIVTARRPDPVPWAASAPSVEDDGNDVFRQTWITQPAPRGAK